jgi:hypothetical protein
MLFHESMYRNDHKNEKLYVSVMVFNATFNIISATSFWSDLLLEDTLFIFMIISVHRFMKKHKSIHYSYIVTIIFIVVCNRSTRRAPQPAECH